MTWIVAAASLTATWLNIRRVRACFAIWCCTVTWASYDFAHELPAQGALMLIYAALAVWGWFAWSSGHREIRSA